MPIIRRKAGDPKNALPLLRLPWETPAHTPPEVTFPHSGLGLVGLGIQAAGSGSGSLASGEESSGEKPSESESAGCAEGPWYRTLTLKRVLARLRAL